MLAPLAQIVRLYGLRKWVEQSYKQMKDELGWADFMVRRDRALRRHWTLVCCAFAFCWWHETWQARVAGPAMHPLGNRCAANGRGKKLTSTGHLHVGRARCARYALGWPQCIGSGVAGIRSPTSPRQPISLRCSKSCQLDMESTSISVFNKPPIDRFELVISQVELPDKVAVISGARLPWRSTT